MHGTRIDCAAVRREARGRAALGGQAAAGARYHSSPLDLRTSSHRQTPSMSNFPLTASSKAAAPPAGSPTQYTVEPDTDMSTTWKPKPPSEDKKSFSFFKSGCTKNAGGSKSFTQAVVWSQPFVLKVPSRC